jgi:hypothetical protein
MDFEQSHPWHVMRHMIKPTQSKLSTREFETTHPGNGLHSHEAGSGAAPCVRAALGARFGGVLAHVRLTALALSCTARAHVLVSSGAAAAAHTAGQQRKICSRRDTAAVLFGPGGSAAGPKPGRASFSD